MSFQCYFRYLGQIARNLGIDACDPKGFLDAKCLVKEILAWSVTYAEENE